MNLRTILQISIFSMLFASCLVSRPIESDQKDLVAASQKKLVESDWRINGISGEVFVGTDQEESPYMAFTYDGKLYGSIGCTPFSGSYRLREGSRITFDSLDWESTECNTSSIRGRFDAALQSTNSFTISGEGLLFLAGEAFPTISLKVQQIDFLVDLKIYAAYKREKKMIISSVWVLDRVQGKRIKKRRGSPLPYLNFKSNGTMEGRIGCQSISGNYKIEIGGEVNLEVTVIETASCITTSDESRLLGLLDAVNSYSFKDGKLKLTSRLLDAIIIFNPEE